jgi:hypothetical protein
MKENFLSMFGCFVLYFAFEVKLLLCVPKKEKKKKKKKLPQIKEHNLQHLILLNSHSLKNNLQHLITRPQQCRKLWSHIIYQ